tara:strand:+ start:303 stop:1148 length:846 start_codon:yes stop_codon:yes gene_type:complete
MAIGAFLAKAGLGLLSGFQQKKAAEANQQFQVDQQNLAYDRSLPWSNYGPAGNVEFDPETKQILQTLDPQYQAMMQGFLGSSAMANEELQSMMGDPYAMEQQQFKRFEDFNADAYNQQRLAQQEQAIAQGRTGTQGYYDQMAIEDAIGRDRMRGQMQAMQTGMDYRNMLRAEALAMGEGARNVAGMLTPQADLGRMVGQGSNATGNMAGVRTAGDNLADTRAGFWSGLAGQAQDYNFGNFSSMLTKGGNAARRVSRAMNPTVKSSLFNQGRIGNNQFEGDY